jgi:hypothetical protein
MPRSRSPSASSLTTVSGSPGLAASAMTGVRCNWSRLRLLTRTSSARVLLSLVWPATRPWWRPMRAELLEERPGSAAKATRHATTNEFMSPFARNFFFASSRKAASRRLTNTVDPKNLPSLASTDGERGSGSTRGTVAPAWAHVMPLDAPTH